MTDETSERRPPAWVDMATLCREICSCPSTVDVLVRERLLPPPQRLRGKFLWKWETVDAWLVHGGDPAQSPGSLEDRIRESARQAQRRAS